MFLTKKRCLITTLAALGLMTSLAGCSDNNAATSNKKVDDMLLTSILDSASNSEIVKTHNTYTLTDEDFIENLVNGGQFSFGDPELLTQPYSYGTITFVKYNVSLSNSAYVTEGTSVATLRLSIDPLEREEARIALEKAQSSYRNSLSKKEESLNDQYAKISKAPTFYEQQLLQAEYDEALAEYNEYIITQDEQIAELQEKYNILLNDEIEFEVIAPVTGYLIAYPTTYNSGDIIDNDEYIAAIYPAADMYIKVNSGKFKYGDTVNILYKSGNSEYKTTGTVVSAGNVLYHTSSNTCKIYFDPTGLPDMSGLSSTRISRINLQISIDRTITEDALILPISTLGGVRGNSSSVIRYMEDGSTYKTNVKVVYRNNQNAWIMGGLEKGDQVVQ